MVHGVVPSFAFNKGVSKLPAPFPEGRPPVADQSPLSWGAPASGGPTTALLRGACKWQTDHRSSEGRPPVADQPPHSWGAPASGGPTTALTQHGQLATAGSVDSLGGGGQGGGKDEVGSRERNRLHSMLIVAGTLICKKPGWHDKNTSTYTSVEETFKKGMLRPTF